MNKLVLFTVTTISISSVANAQISKGTMLAGANVSTHNYRSEADVSLKTRSNIYYLNSTWGYAFKDNNVIGLNLTYGHAKTTQGESRSETDTYGAGVFYRRYLTLGRGFSLFGQAQAGYDLRDGEAYYLSRKNTTRQHTFGVGLYPGISYALNKRIHLEAGVNNLLNFGYNTSTARIIYPTWQRESRSSGWQFNNNANQQTNITAGFRIALGK